jgi:hypothetical protein
MAPFRLQRDPEASKKKCPDRLRKSYGIVGCRQLRPGQTRSSGMRSVYGSGLKDCNFKLPLQSLHLLRKFRFVFEPRFESPDRCAQGRGLSSSFQPALSASHCSNGWPTLLRDHWPSFSGIVIYTCMWPQHRCPSITRLSCCRASSALYP